MQIIVYFCEIVRNLPLLTCLPDTTIKELASRSRIEEYQYGETVVKDTADNYFLWFIVTVIGLVYLKFITLFRFLNLYYKITQYTNIIWYANKA